MSLQRLDVRGLRNLREATLDDCGRINILSGPNGSGKTSILEAIYILGLGRSFRSSQLAPIINHEMSACAVFGELMENKGGCQNIGVQRSRQGKQSLKINKSPIENIAELALALPLQLINADAFELVDGGPKVRRQFIDWGVFHVKPAFLGHWRRAQHCLRQRNHLLRERGARHRGRICGAELTAWDQELVSCAGSIDHFRSQYVDELYPLFNQMLRRLVDLPSVSLDYQRGWRADQDLQAALEANLDRDIRLGTTSVGPHRANVEIRVGGVLAADVLSRGQLKLVVSSLRLAQGAHLASHRNARCVYLIDDLPAELDKEHRTTFCRLLDEMGCQVFITSVDADVIDSSWDDRSAIRQFHVKQGRVFNER